jgi:hypothetical protein
MIVAGMPNLLAACGGGAVRAPGSCRPSLANSSWQPLDQVLAALITGNYLTDCRALRPARLEVKARTLAGIKGYVTNLAACPDGTPVTADFVIGSYHGVLANDPPRGRCGCGAALVGSG